MRKLYASLEEVKNSILQLKGKTVKMEINKGRKKIVHYSGTIENVYPSLFTVKFLEGNELNIEKNSFSYFDVMCGDIKITDIV